MTRLNTESESRARQTQLDTERIKALAVAAEKARQSEAEGRRREWEAQAERQRLEGQRLRQQALLATAHSQAEQAKAAAEVEKFRIAAQQETERAHIAAQQESERAHLLAEKENAEKERLVREQQAKIAAEATELRRKAEEAFHRPVKLPLAEVWRKGNTLKGRTVIIIAPAACKLFPSGSMTVAYYDPKNSRRVLVRATLFDVKADPAWQLREGVSQEVKINLQGVVDAIESGGVVRLVDCRVLAMD